MYIYWLDRLFQFPLFSEYCDVYIGLGEYVGKSAHGKKIALLLFTRKTVDIYKGGKFGV